MYNTVVLAEIMAVLLDVILIGMLGVFSEVMSFLCETRVALGTILLLLYGDMKA